MFKRNRFDERYNQVDMNQNYMGMNYPNGQMYPNMEWNRLLYEIKENRRRINNLAKRITRIESYLRIKDTSDYSYIEEENKPNDFSF